MLIPGNPTSVARAAADAARHRAMCASVRADVASRDAHDAFRSAIRDYRTSVRAEVDRAANAYGQKLSDAIRDTTNNAVDDALSNPNTKTT